MTATDSIPAEGDLISFRSDSNINNNNAKLLANSMIGFPSDEDSAIADVDRWATSSSVGDSSSQIKYVL